MKAAEEWIVSIRTLDGSFKSYASSDIEYLDGREVPRHKADRHFSIERAQAIGECIGAIVSGVLGIPLIVEVERV